MALVFQVALMISEPDFQINSAPDIILPVHRITDRVDTAYGLNGIGHAELLRNYRAAHN
jgi:hypothetical protein